MSAYRFVIVFGALLFVILLWIPLGYYFGIVADILNATTTDPGTIERNNMAVQLFYYTLFIIIIASIIYVMKPDKDETEQGAIQYVPAYV